MQCSAKEAWWDMQDLASRFCVTLRVEALMQCYPGRGNMEIMGSMLSCYL